MGRTRSNKRAKDGESESDGSDKPADCTQQMKKQIVGMFTPRKAASNTSVMKTPGSVTRRMGPPRNYSQTPKSALRSAISHTVTGLHFTALKEQDPIQVFCRVKPLVGSVEGCIQIKGEHEIALIPPENPAYWRQNQAKEGHYGFSQIFDSNSAQKAVFNEVALPLVADFVEGKNALLFAYGVTGSGKTFTMSGKAGDCGIMPRCLDVLFNSIAQFKATKYIFKPDRMNGFESQSKADAMHERQKEIIEKTREAGRTPRSRARNPANDAENFSNRSRDETSVPVSTTDSFYSVFITHIEIYNNFVYDLLDESPIEIGKKSGLQSKMLREDVCRNVYVNGVTEVEVESPEEAFEVFQRGLRRRRIAHTALNTESSRSHSVFNIRLVRAPADSEGEEVNDNKEHITVSQLSLVDLAGSERHSRSHATGDRLKEAGNINNSLMTLRKCMDILRENQQTNSNGVVPFRNSKLTHFLKNYFEGEGRVRMILCVNPRPDDYDENFHVLSFAEQAQEVQITRPQEKKLIDVQTPGRVKANELYKESVRQMDLELLLPKTDTTFAFNNIPIPICQITKSNEAAVIATLIRALEMRVVAEAEGRQVVHKKQEDFRTILVDWERETFTLSRENTSLKVAVQTLTEERSKHDNVLRRMMNEKGDLEIQVDEKQKQIEEMQEELDDLRMKFRQRDVQHFKEKELLKSDLDLKRELDELNRNRQLHLKESKMKAQFKQKEQTLAAVRDLVSTVDLPREGHGGSRQSRNRSRDFVVLEESFSTTSSEPDLISIQKKSKKIIQIRPRAPSAPLLPIGNSTPLGESSHIRRNAGMPSTYRPRARSTNKDFWVEHTSGIAVKEGTVFQPVITRGVSVSKLTNAEDFIERASKYCLTTQEQDSAGEIETKLYKADVVTSVAGGASVIFNDVEVLRQESPRTSPRKRRSSGINGLGLVSCSPFRNQPSQYEEDVGQRCRQGVGSSIVKRSRPT